MSTTIDQKVVEMQFDNRQFERNVSTTMSSIDKLKQKLNLTGASKGLENVETASRGVTLSGIVDAAENVGLKFNAMYSIADQALRNITNSAMAAGKKIVSALTIDPIKTGLSEYETQINAVQTIMANTSSKGTTLDQVNGALDELNTYADKTIYNFTEMTRNIGTFTAAGVDLDTSVKSIQGIANLAAVSGSTSQQASTAMYQLSQALAAGKVQLMDWNSVVNAGMGGQVFQDALKRTATAMGTNVDAMIKKYGSFRESLTQGEWLTAEVLTKTLEQFTMAAKEGSKEWEAYKKSLMDEGYTEKQAEEILKMANTATDAATKVKTFTQLWDTLKETAQSGWTQTWEIILGDFEEAKSLFSELYQTLSPVIEAMSESRNKLLEGALGGESSEPYKKLTEDLLKLTPEQLKSAGYTDKQIKALQKLKTTMGETGKSFNQLKEEMYPPTGRELLIDSLRNAFKAVAAVVKPVKEAFREIFPPITSKQLYGMIEGLHSFTEKLIISEDKAAKFKSIFKGVFSILDIGRKIVSSVAKAFLDLANSDGVSSLGDFLLNTLASFGDFFTSLNESFDTGGLTGMLSEAVSGISNFFGLATGKIESFGDVLVTVGKFVSDVIGKIWGGVKTVFGWFADTFSVGDIFAGLAGGGIFIAAKKVSGLMDNIVDKIKDIFGGDGKGSIKEIVGKFGDILDSVGDSLNAFSMGVKIGSLVSIAVAIGILSASLNTISKLEVGNIVKSLVTIGLMMGMLGLTFKSINKTLSKYDSKGLVKAGVSLVLISASISILAGALEKISKLSLKDITKGLIGVGGGLVELSVGLKIIGKTKISLSTSIAMIALAESCSILGDALRKFATLSWDEIGRGLTAMGGALGEFVAAIAVMGKFGGINSLLGSAGLLIAVQSLQKMSDGLKSFAEMAWDEIDRGLTAMGGALGEVAGITGALGKLAGFSGLFGSGAILIVVQGLDDLANALKKFGEMAWGEIGRGLTAMGGALTEVAGITGALGKLAGFSSIFAAGSILIVIQGLSDLAEALKSFGAMAWDEIGRGLVAMGGALAEVGVITGTLGKLAGFSSLFGAGSILVVIQGLDDIANALKKFGGMTWDEIGRGLVGMGGALGEIAIITGALGGLAGLPSLLGSGSILIAVQGLGDIADALKKFGEMSWDEIKKGLSAMGGALGEIALGGFLNTLSGIGALAITEIANSLGTLADSVKKWVGVTLPEELGMQLGQLASGVNKFTFAGAGASALSDAAPAVGILADSVRKWSGVTIPKGLTEKLDKLADGIKKFTWSGMGASALADAAPAVGTLADSVKKWAGVTVPENIESDLSSVAKGVKAFSFAFAGGWSMSALVKPLGELPGSIKKWSGVTIPEGMESGLKSLAKGIKSFSFAFAGGWSMEAIIGPLGDMPGAIKKWSGVTIPEGLGNSLKSLANGIKPFAGVGDISKSASSISSLVDAVKDLNGVSFKNINTNIESLISSISKLKSINSVGKSIKGLGENIVSSLLVPLTNASGKFSRAGADLISKFTTGFTSKRGAVVNAVNSVISQIGDKIASMRSKFQSIGVQIVASFVTGVNSQRSKLSSVFVSVLSGAVSTIRGYYSSFSSAGAYLVSGFTSGIRSNITSAASAAASMAAAAVAAARAHLRINSPSKVFYGIGDYSGQGFVNALYDFADAAYDAGSEMANSAKSGLGDAISRITDIVNSDMDTQPTIRPVLDLSNIEAGASSINGMLGMRPSVGVLAHVGAISSTMGQNGQNGGNRDVVSAIDKLRRDMAGVRGDSITIGNVTYDDGSNINEAVKAIVRAAKMGRRS